MGLPAVPQLRPLGLGERLDAAFKIFGRSFVPMAKAVLVIAVPAGVIDALITTSTALPANSGTGQTVFGTGSTVSVHAGDTSAYFAGLFVVFLVSEVVTAVATATCYRIIASVYLGQPVAWR
ncbi:MAG TPA: hypothetical protein VEG62_04245, partial [Acidimicrobiales bacterium]|nr:hypothetical protein [Acidimicrobiales bacterium]